MNLHDSPTTPTDQLSLDFGFGPSATDVVHDSEGREASDIPETESEVRFDDAGASDATCSTPEGTGTEPPPNPAEAELGALEPGTPDLPKAPNATRGRKKSRANPLTRKVRLAPDSRLTRFVYLHSDGLVDLELDESVLAAAQAGLSHVETGAPLQAREPLDSYLHGLLKRQPLLVLLAKLGAGQLDQPLTTCVRAFLRELRTHSNPTDPAHEGAFYHLSLAVRLLSAVQVSWLAEVLKLTAPPCDAPAIADALRSYLHVHKDVEQRDALEKMERAFAFLIGAREPRPRSDDEEDSPDQGGKKRPSPASDPFATDEDLLDTDASTTFDVGPARRKNRINPIPIAVQRAFNQVIGVEERNYLTSHELVLLRDELLLEESSHRAVLAASLWGGLWSRSIASWAAFGDVTTALSTPNWEVCVVAEPLAFLVSNGAQASLPSSLGRVAATHLYLPIAPGRLGADALAAKAMENSGSTLFGEDDLRGLNGRILELRLNLGAEFTTRAVQAQMKKVLRQVSGDEGLSALLHGTPIPTHLIARASYRRWTLRGLAAAFDDGCAHLEHQLRWGTTHWHPPKTTTLRDKAPAGIDWDARVGSLRCPDLGEAKDMTRSLRRGLATPPSGHPHPGRVIEIHRRLLAHTVTLLIWAVAARPGDSALNALQKPVNDTVLLEEKATTEADPRRRKRAVRLSPMALEQLRYWKLHREFVLQSLPKRQSESPLFFDIDRTGSVLPLTYGRYRQLASHWLCDSNAGRHALTSALIDLGLPATRVNVLLGHALPGEEVGAPLHAGWPRFSDEELLLVDTHLQSVGFEALRGYRTRGSR